MTEAEVFTEDEVSEIVGRAHSGGNVRLSDYTVKARDRHGYLGVHLTLTVRAEIRGREVEDSFFVKSYKVPPEGQIDFLGETGMFQKEVYFYRDVFHEFWRCFRGREWCPKYYFSKNRVLVLEDLSVLGYQMKDGFTLADERHIKLVLQSVAALHASSIVYERSTSNSLDGKYPACFKEILYDETNTKAPSYKWKGRQIRDLMAAVDYLEKYTPEEKKRIRRYLPATIDKIYPLNKKSDRWLNVMVHGDMWSNNLMFRYETGNPVDCRLVDYQFSRYAPPMHDIMHLLHLTTDKPIRDEIEASVLRSYHESLSENLAYNNLDVNEVLPWESFMETKNSYKLLALIQSLLSMHYLLGGRRVQDESKHGEWSKSDLDPYLTKESPDNVKILFSDETYTKRVVTILCELIDDYILNEKRRTSMGITLSRTDES